MSERQDTMKLFAFLWNTGAHAAGWRYSPDGPDSLHSLEFFTRLARTAETGALDAVFFADSVGFHRVAGRDAFARTDLVKLEPLTLLAALAARTSRIGLVATASTTFNHPYTLARQFASLDHLSAGRIGWNIVTSTAENEAHNFGLPRNLPHEERYARAREFVDVVRGLWDSFEDGAVLMDAASGRYTDPDKIHGLGHAGPHFTVAGPLNVARPPQGHPVLVQAGSSGTGRAFAAEVAEVIFTSHPTLEGARHFYQEVKQLVGETGRDPDQTLILPSISPLVGSTEAEAKRMARELDELLHDELAVSLLGSFLGGVDLTEHPLDGPLPAVAPTENARSTQTRILDWARAERLSIRETAHRVAAQRTSSYLVGAPEQIADALADWFTGGAADGFVLGFPHLPGGLESFVETVVPLLRARGLFRQRYEGATLRDHLGLPRPANTFVSHPERHVEPEVW